MSINNNKNDIKKRQTPKNQRSPNINQNKSLRIA